MRKPASYHKFTAKPVDNAYIDRGEREGNMKRQRTYWKKKMLMGEGREPVGGRDIGWLERGAEALGNAYWFKALPAYYRAKEKAGKALKRQGDKLTRDPWEKDFNPSSKDKEMFRGMGIKEAVQAMVGRPTPQQDNPTQRRLRTTKLGNDSYRKPLPPEDRRPTMVKPRTSNSVREDFIEFILLEGEFSHATRQFLASRGMRGRGGKSFRRQALQRMKKSGRENVAAGAEIGVGALAGGVIGAAGGGVTGAGYGAQIGAAKHAEQAMTTGRVAQRVLQKLPKETSSDPRVPKGVAHLKTREAVLGWAKNPKNTGTGVGGWVRRKALPVVAQDMVPSKGEKDFTGSNAAFLAPATPQGTPAVIAPRDVAGHIMRHEVGHSKDFAGKTMKDVVQSQKDPITNLKSELRAWRNAGVAPNDPVRKVMIGTYKAGARVQAGAKEGAKKGLQAGGAVGGVGGAIAGASMSMEARRSRQQGAERAAAAAQAARNLQQRRKDAERFSSAVGRRYAEAASRRGLKEAVMEAESTWSQINKKVDKKIEQGAKKKALDLYLAGHGKKAKPGDIDRKVDAKSVAMLARKAWQSKKRQQARRRVTEDIIRHLVEQQPIGQPSALNIQRGTPGTAARPGGGQYRPGGPSGGRMMDSSRMAGGGRMLGRSIGGGGMGGRGVVSPQMSAQRTAMRNRYGSSSSMGGGVRFNTGSASGSFSGGTSRYGGNSYTSMGGGFRSPNAAGSGGMYSRGRY